MSLPSFTSLKDKALIALDAISDRTANVLNPTVKLGVTGLSRAGKTVFITSLVHNFIQGDHLPIFNVAREGRLLKVKLGEQPDSNIARFEYEKHLDALLQKQIWPESTRSLSQLRIELYFAPHSSAFPILPRGKLNIDLIDYPGEWLLDLPLLAKSYRQFSDESIERAKSGNHAKYAAKWLAEIQSINLLSDANERDIDSLSNSFKNYLQSAKNDGETISALPPGRFLIPGSFDGAPVLSFSPLPDLGTLVFPENSIAKVMEQRYELYKRHVIMPFFREHIARLDRQIILVDALQAINNGRDSITEMQNALAEILSCFRIGKNHWLKKLWKHKVNRILIAATKSDHLHHTSHDRLEDITSEIVQKALKISGSQDISNDTLAIASIRSTREGTIDQKGTMLPVVIGTPLAGEVINGLRFDGKTETAVFPGDLPESLGELLDKNWHDQLHFIRFRPPKLTSQQTFPHIRLDRAMEFLFGDYLI